MKLIRSAFLSVLLILATVAFSGEIKELSSDLVRTVDRLRTYLRPHTSLTNKVSNADVWLQIGLLLQSAEAGFHGGGGRLKLEARDAFDKSIFLNNGSSLKIDAQAFFFRGILLKTLGEGQESLNSFDYVLTLHLNFHDVSTLLYNKAETLFMMGRLQDAVTLYRDSLDLLPCRLERYYNLVQCYRESKHLRSVDWHALVKEIQSAITDCTQSGSFDRRTAIAVVSPESERTESYDALTGIGDDTRPSYLEVNGIGSSHISSATYWALFIAAEGAGQEPLAWESLERAHEMELAVRARKFSRSQAEEQYKQIEMIFHKGFWTDLITPKIRSKSSKLPVFIVGMMRSGSTLLETMLDAHSQIWGMGEDSVFNGNISSFRDRLVAAGNQGGQPAMEKVVLDYGAATVRKMRDLAAGGRRNESRRVKHVIDKMLFNYRNIGLIHLVYPNALILHTVRDPMDTLFSCYKNKFDDGGLEWTLDAKDLVLQYTLYLKTMAHFRRVLPNRVVDLRYEDLVTDPERVLREIVVGRLKLKWEASVLDYHAMGRVRQSTYTSSIGSWRRYAKQLAPLRREWRRQMAVDTAATTTTARENREYLLPFGDDMNWEMKEDFDYHLDI
eukprot:gene22684-30966_t